MVEPEIDRKIAVIFVADVVGYSKHMEKNEDATLVNYSECENIFKSLFKNNTPKPETQSFQASNLQTAISKILVRTAKIDDEFHILEEKKILEGRQIGRIVLKHK